MISPRVQDFLRTLDAQLPASILAILDERELVFSMEFKDDKSTGGELTVYRPSDTAAGATTVPVEKHWVYANRVWFRRDPNPGRDGAKYEAYVSYLPEYRDPVVVHLDEPLLRMRLPYPPVTVPETRAPVAQCQLQPELQF